MFEYKIDNTHYKWNALRPFICSYHRTLCTEYTDQSTSTDVYSMQELIKQQVKVKTDVARTYEFSLIVNAHNGLKKVVKTTIIVQDCKLNQVTSIVKKGSNQKYDTDLKIPQSEHKTQTLELPETSFSLQACVMDQFRVTGESVIKGDVKIENGQIVYASSVLQTMKFDLEIQYTKMEWETLPMSITIWNPC